MGTGHGARRVMVLLILATLAIGGQTAGITQSGPRVLDALQTAQVRASVPDEVVREIDDPHTGTRWLLIRDPRHTGGPGRLLLAESTRNPARQEADLKPSRVEPRPVLHAGDRLIVEENTQVVESRLEAVALGPAVIGSVLNVRLSLGGKVVRVVALAPGRAMLQPREEARP